MSSVKYGHVLDVNRFCLETINHYLSDPAYRDMSLRKAKIQMDSVQRGDYLCLFDQEGNVIAFLTYIRISSKAAERCLEENTPPPIKEARKVGDAIFINSITGQQTAKLARQFFRMCLGHKVLYCRHFKNGRANDTANVVYVDEQGKRRSELR